MIIVQIMPALSKKDSQYGLVIVFMVLTKWLDCDTTTTLISTHNTHVCTENIQM